jgi:hypothetical protein
VQAKDRNEKVSEMRLIGERRKIQTKECRGPTVRWGGYVDGVGGRMGCGVEAKVWVRRYLSERRDAIGWF